MQHQFQCPRLAKSYQSCIFKHSLTNTRFLATGYPLCAFGHGLQSPGRKHACSKRRLPERVVEVSACSGISEAGSKGIKCNQQAAPSPGSGKNGRRKYRKGLTLTDYPCIVQMWHSHKNGSMRPEDVSHGSKKLVWLHCPGCPKCGEMHEWQARVARARALTQSGGNIVCPNCASRAGSFCSCRSVAATPGLLTEWHEDNPPPDTVAIGSNKKFSWRCSHKACGHVWEAPPKDRSSSGSNCPECAQSRKLKHDKLTCTVEGRDLVAEWDVEQNTGLPGDYSCGSNVLAWWRCSKCGHSWQAIIANRACKGRGFPKCSVKTRGQPRKFTSTVAAGAGR